MHACSAFILIFAQNIDCGYTLELFWNKNKKNRYTPVCPHFYLFIFFFFNIKVGHEGVYISGTCSPDVNEWD